MISATSTTDKYALQPGLIEMHKESLEWLSASILWKRELVFFQNLLDQHAQDFTAVEDKKEIDHYQSLIIYYQGELVDQLRHELRDLENHLAKTLQDHDEGDTEYFKQHHILIDKLESFNKQFQDMKHSFYRFIEKVL
jgi:hypothetical protein